MHERQRVEILRDLLASRGFRSIVDTAAIVVDPGAGLAEAA